MLFTYDSLPEKFCCTENVMFLCQDKMSFSPSHYTYLAVTLIRRVVKLVHKLTFISVA